MRAAAQRTGIIAVVAAALTMGLTFAHTLELPQKLGYDAATWTRVQQSLYRYFGLVGGPLEVATVIAAVVFTVRARGRPGGRMAAVGAAVFVTALAWWFVVVNTANAQIGGWAVDAPPLGALAGAVGVRARGALRVDPGRLPGAAAGHRAGRRRGRRSRRRPHQARARTGRAGRTTRRGG